MSNNEKIFGIHCVESFLNSSPENVVQLFLQKGRRDKKINEIELSAKSFGISVQVTDRRKLDNWVKGKHQGLVAEVKLKGNELNENQLLELIEEKGCVLLLVLDGITDPHNLGACLRTADAVGVDAIVVPKDRSAPLNAAARKVACGAAESVPVVQVTNLARYLSQLKQRSVWIVGTAAEASRAHFDSQYTGSLALVMGAEGRGMRRLTKENCDELIKIPMAGSVSSLNVSVATGICLYEILRQRGAGGQ